MDESHADDLDRRFKDCRGDPPYDPASVLGLADELIE
jgi:hypothetical protein